MVDMRNHDHAVLNGQAEEGDETDGRRNVKCHSPDIQRQESSEKCQRQQHDEQSCLSEISERPVQQNEHDGQYERNDNGQPGIGPALVLELAVPF